MGDPGKFETLMQYYQFMLALLAVFVMEGIILIVTYQKKTEAKKSDKGTRWLICIGFYTSIYFSFFMVSQIVPKPIRELILPRWTAWIGIAMIWLGIIIRIIAVRTLKKAFTLSVQTTASQELITNGIYGLIRNPAYTGSILSLIGIAVSLGNLLAILLSFVICMICYSMRINVEEKALELQFGDRYFQYEKNTYRLFPYIW